MLTFKEYLEMTCKEHGIDFFKMDSFKQQQFSDDVFNKWTNYCQWTRLRGQEIN